MPGIETGVEKANFPTPGYVSRPACAYWLEPTHFYSHPVSLLPGLNSLSCRPTSTARKPCLLMGSLSVRNSELFSHFCHSLRWTHLPCAISFQFHSRDFILAETTKQALAQSGPFSPTWTLGFLPLIFLFLLFFLSFFFFFLN